VPQKATNFKWYVKTPLATCTCPHCGGMMRVGIQLRVYTDKGGCSVWKVVKTSAKREARAFQPSVEEETQNGE